MNYGFPGSNTHFEQHGVTEESFWPSFTDIMMVIVMVFLLVTVAVILNNWSLIADLKNSIKAQEVASSLAENRQVENLSLGKKLKDSASSIETLSEKFAKVTGELSETQQQLVEKKSVVAFLKTQITTLNTDLADNKNSLVDAKEQLFVLNDKYELEKSRLIEAKKELSAKEVSLSQSQLALSEKSETFEVLQKDYDSTLEKADVLAVKFEASKVESLDEKNTLAAKISQLEASLKSKQSDLDKSVEKTKQLEMLSDKQKITLDKSVASLKVMATDYDELLDQKNTLAARIEDSDAENLKGVKSFNLQIKDLEEALQSKQDNLNKTLESNKELVISFNTQKKDLEVAVNAQAFLEAAVKERDLSVERLKKTEVDNRNQLSVVEASSEQLAATLKDAQVEKAILEDKLSLLVSDYEKSQKALELSTASSRKLEKELATVQKNQTSQKSSLSQAELLLSKKEDEKQRILNEMNDRLSQSDEKLAMLEKSLENLKEQLGSKDKEISLLRERQGSGNAQLLSLQGDYDVLDSKYQKLLLPARSSKGKFVVSVIYRSNGSRKIIRFKDDPSGSYSVISINRLHKNLVELKQKHGSELYLKVIIPENSGLSYSEAWKFTNELQKKYDYYYQDN